MKWLKRKIWAWANEGQDLQDEIDQKDWAVSGKNAICLDDLTTPDMDPTMNFKVYNANGGKIVEFRQYDRVNDRSNNKLYIISEDQDFGDAIKKIAMMHLLSVHQS
jgi:hypothetical protein